MSRNIKFFFSAFLIAGALICNSVYGSPATENAIREPAATSEVKTETEMA